MTNIQDSKIPPSTTTTIAKGDSSASNQYSPLRDIEALHNVVSDKFSPTVVLPDKSTLIENANVQLPLLS